MNKENVDEVLRKFAHKYKNYRFSKLSLDSVKKVWNHGMGLLEIYKVYPREGIIAVNDFLYNRTDERKLSLLKQVLGGECDTVANACAWGALEDLAFGLDGQEIADDDSEED